MRTALALMLLAGLIACGKKGNPKRPVPLEIPAEEPAEGPADPVPGEPIW
ncbi:hypothetical protein LNKW23_20490 [Paralimibaculum aggregatum]|uniref:Lipoprotein n=1 Tax=Paralimibaculum aggregatum TaxID=3036245 RepID=A0ABQ6LQB2_9RHOB|nr:hypothetical protein [Limibaculum sp. NKW23]GMG82836.1 hypothetical protein LNKW23_20490 [Limibaculum sp. NKW23]